MAKVVNTSTFMALTNAQIKLNDHIQRMNTDGWELMSVFVEAVGIEELLFMFWRKTVNE